MSDLHAIAMQYAALGAVWSPAERRHSGLPNGTSERTTDRWLTFPDSLDRGEVSMALESDPAVYTYEMTDAPAALSPAAISQIRNGAAEPCPGGSMVHSELRRAGLVEQTTVEGLRVWRFTKPGRIVSSMIPGGWYAPGLRMLDKRDAQPLLDAGVIVELDERHCDAKCGYYELAG